MSWLQRGKNAAKIAALAKSSVGATPHEVVHRENKWSLLRYRSTDTDRRYHIPVVLIPSVVNRHYILDLMPGKSVAEFLVGRGHDVYCLDWGTPEAEDRFVRFDDVVDRALARVLRVACRLADSEQAHVLGYCLGGTFAAIHAAVRPARVASLTALAAPVRFDDDGLLSTWTRTPTFDVRGLVDAFGLVPGALMQASFQMLRPTMKLARLMGLVDGFENEAFLRTFFAMERWGWETASLPGEFYVSLIERLYRDNDLIHDRLTLSGRPVRLRDIVAPTVAITFEHDTIAPPDSCRALLDAVSSSDTLHIHKPGSHVGGAVASRALRSLWPEVSEFWAARDSNLQVVAG